MEKKKRDKLEVRIDNARITFRNFEGLEKKFNPPGNRNFSIFLPDDVAKEMEAAGWSVKWLNSYEDEAPQAVIGVKLNFGNYPPNVVLVADGKMTRLDETNISVLDYAELEQVDVILRGYEWEVSGKTGVKAYLKTGYFVLVVDELAKKYSNEAGLAQESLDDNTEEEKF
jgi:hypothetical protein